MRPRPAPSRRRLTRSLAGRVLAAPVLAALLGSLLPTTALAAAAARPAKAPTSRHMAVPFYRQQLANDCEAAALRMVLAYRGHPRSDARLLKDIHVDLKHRRYGVSGRLSGDPYVAFVGSPNGSELGGTGFGVYNTRIGVAARANGAFLLADQHNYSPKRLYAQLLAGHPAVVWVDYLWRHLPTRWYTAYDGRRIPYAGPAEHAIVLAGVTKNGVYVNDPARGKYWISKKRFEAGYATYRDMAVVIR